MLFSDQEMYTCKVNSADIQKPGEKIERFKGKNCFLKHFSLPSNSTICTLGKHLPRKTHKDVNAIYFSSALVKFIPVGIGEIFKNLQYFGIVNCNLMGISRDDFKGFEQLNGVYIHTNQITYLPDDLFQGLTKLTEISIIYNSKLRYISSKILLNVIDNGLEYVDFAQNGCVNVYYCPGYKNSLRSVQELVEAIDCSMTKQKFEMAEESKDEEFFIVLDCFEYKIKKKDLIKHSPYFKTMFKNDPEADAMELTGFSSNTVTSFIGYLHTGQVPREFDAHQLYVLAAECQIKNLELYCEFKLEKNLVNQPVDISKLLLVYKSGVRYKSQKLIKAALDCFKRSSGVNFSNSIDNLQIFQELLEAYQTYEKEIKTHAQKIDKAKTNFLAICQKY